LPNPRFGATAVPDLTSIAGINLNEGFPLPSTTPPIAFRPPDIAASGVSDEVVGPVSPNRRSTTSFQRTQLAKQRGDNLCSLHSILSKSEAATLQVQNFGTCGR
jgi:hypothetical protein